MEEQMNEPMIVANTPLSAIEIPGKLSNKLILLLPYCLLLFVADLTSFSFIGDVFTSMELLSKQDLNSPESKEVVERVLRGVCLLLGTEIFFLACLWLFSLFSLLAMLYTTSHEQLSTKELFSKLGRSWRRQVITWFYTTFIIVFMVLLVLILIKVSSLKTTGVPLIFLSTVIVMMSTLCYVYLAAVWMFSMVMSIAELDIKEDMAVEKYEEYNKGKKLQGFVPMLVTSVVGIIMVALVYDKRSSSGTPSTNGIRMLCYVCLLKILMFVLYSMYSYDCKSKNQDQVDTAEYSPIKI